MRLQRSLTTLVALFTFLVLLSCCSTVSAAVVAGWDVNGLDVEATLSSTDSYAFDAGTQAANVSQARLTLGDVNPSTTAGRYGFKISTSDTNNSLADAVTDNHFLEFSVTIANGFQLDLESLDFVGDTTPTGADDVAVFTSIDGFNAGSEIASLSGRQAVNTGALDTDSSGFGNVIDLSASQYQGLTGTVSFRIYGFNTGSGSGSTFIRSLGGDDLIVNGAISATAVPEPSCFALIALLGLVIQRRRRV